MDKELIRQRFAAARLTYGEQARVQHLVVLRMMELLRSYLLKEPRCIYEFGCGTGDYSRLLLGLHPDRLVLNDLCPEMEESLTDILTSPCASFIPGDAEQLDIPGITDVITSCSTVQWFTSLPDFFQRCRQAMTTGGILAFTTFGPHNMQEIRALTGNGLYYPEMEKLIGMLPAGFRLLHASQEVRGMEFSTPVEVLRHLKQTGVTGTERRMWTRSRLDEFCHRYIERFSCNNGVTLTYHPVYIIASAI